MRYNLISKKNKLPIDCGAFGCKCKTFKNPTRDTYQCAYCGTTYPKIPELTEIPNILGRFPYRREEAKIVFCHKCLREFHWENGGEGGNIYSCENECGRYICVSCIIGDKDYQKEIIENIDGISGLENIFCLICKEESK